MTLFLFGGIYLIFPSADLLSYNTKYNKNDSTSSAGWLWQADVKRTQTEKLNGASNNYIFLESGRTPQDHANIIQSQIPGRHSGPRPCSTASSCATGNHPDARAVWILCQWRYANNEQTTQANTTAALNTSGEEARIQHCANPIHVKDLW